jgi:zinc and cadmium transporter
MANLFWAISASIIVSLISLIGIFSLLLKESWLNKILVLLIGFSAGALIGAAFLHLLPEATEQSKDFCYLRLYYFLYFGKIFLLAPLS